MVCYFLLFLYDCFIFYLLMLFGSWIFFNLYSWNTLGLYIINQIHLQTYYRAVYAQTLEVQWALRWVATTIRKTHKWWKAIYMEKMSPVKIFRYWLESSVPNSCEILYKYYISKNDWLSYYYSESTELSEVTATTRIGEIFFDSYALWFSPLLHCNRPILQNRKCLLVDWMALISAILYRIIRCIYMSYCY